MTVGGKDVKEHKIKQEVSKDFTQGEVKHWFNSDYLLIISIQ